MNSKSPFAMKSPLHVYKNDQKGNYANPKYVKEEILGVAIGEAMTKTSENIFSGLTEKNEDKKLQNKINKERLDISNINRLEISAAEPAREAMKKLEYDMNNPSSKLSPKITIPERTSNLSKGNNLPTYAEAYKNDLEGVRTTKGYKNYEAYLNDMKGIKKGDNRDLEREAARSAINMNGSPNKLIEDTMKKSPVKHNASAVGSIAGAQPQGQSAISLAGSMQGGNSMAGIRAIGQKPTDSAQGGGGMFAAAAQAAGGLREFASQNKAYQESLPPPNQVAESGSYAGTGDRMLEMDSNPIGNQSIGRNTDVASQLFGSGQRASMLAMKGTPLHNAGHGEKQAHSHPSKTTTKMKPDGLYPGAKYVKGDLVDQDDLLDKTELDAHLATAVKSDKKGSFIKEKPDSGPGSDIDSAKGFGKKIRLNNMARSGYTSNLKDQMDPNKFLFQKTPKK